jgi:predicted nucleic acid-binding protein
VTARLNGRPWTGGDHNRSWSGDRPYRAGRYADGLGATRCRRIRASGAATQATGARAGPRSWRCERSRARAAALIAYFDTSAVVPLLVAEPSSGLCRRLWDDADAVVTSRLTYVDAAALAQALRLVRLERRSHRAAAHIPDRLWDEFDVVDIGDDIMRRAAQLAYSCALRGYDAVHCACAERLGDDDLIVATGDRRLLAACMSLGMASRVGLVSVGLVHSAQLGGWPGVVVLDVPLTPGTLWHSGA